MCIRDRFSTALVYLNYVCLRIECDNDCCIFTCLCIAFRQERIKGTEKASPIHTLFHRYVSSYFWNRDKVTSRAACAAWMFRGGFAWLNAMQNMSSERQWKRKQIESISEYWSEMNRRSPGKRESLDSLTTREISLTRSYPNLSALIKFRNFASKLKPVVCTIK